MRTLLALAIAFAATQALAAEPAPAPEAAADKPSAAQPAPADKPVEPAADAPKASAEPEAKADPARPEPTRPEGEPQKADADSKKAGGETAAVEGETSKGDAKQAKPVDFAPEPIDDQARFLAGLPVAESSPLYPLQQTKFWKAYAKKFDADWEKLRKERLDAMGDWAQKVLAPKIDPKLPVYYLFGGPDFLSVPVLYPEAPVYILGGLEPVGKMPPALRSMSQVTLEEEIYNLRLSLNSIIRLSFFKTNDMRDDLVRTQLRGVVPLLFALAVRSGAKLVGYARVEITDDGELKELGPKDKCLGVPGAKLTLERNGRTQQILYFKHDVSDPVIKAGPGFLSYFKKHAPANTFLKAASFLLHRPHQFGLTRTFLVENSKSILQDDSGLPFELVTKGPFDVNLFGTYLRPRPPFTKKLQPDMDQAFKKGPVEPLPFLTGYRRVGESNLVLAIRKAAAAGTATAP